MASCSCCHKNPPRQGQRYCLKCHATKQRAWRRRCPMTRVQRFKDNARSYAGVYLRRGVIIEQPCRLCGRAAEMHHPDYREPLLVIWLCVHDHDLVHRSKKAAARVDGQYAPLRFKKMTREARRLGKYTNV